MPGSIYYNAAVAVLNALGDPISATAINLLVAWELAEWGGTNDLAITNNPMATTLRMAGSTNWNSAGVQIYPNLSIGAGAVASTLTSGPYPVLTRAIATGNASMFFSTEGIQELSVWASGSPNGDHAYGRSIQSLYSGLPPTPTQYLGTSTPPGPFAGIPLSPWMVLLVLTGAFGLGMAALSQERLIGHQVLEFRYRRGYRT